MLGIGKLEVGSTILQIPVHICHRTARRGIGNLCWYRGPAVARSTGSLVITPAMQAPPSTPFKRIAEIRFRSLFAIVSAVCEKYTVLFYSPKLLHESNSDIFNKIYISSLFTHKIMCFLYRTIAKLKANIAYFSYLKN